MRKVIVYSKGYAEEITIEEFDRRVAAREKQTDDRILLAHYSTTGGKYQIMIYDRQDGTYDVNELTSGKCTHSMNNYTPADVKKWLVKHLHQSKEFDKINFKVVIPMDDMPDFPY